MNFNIQLMARSVTTPAETWERPKASDLSWILLLVSQFEEDKQRAEEADESVCKNHRPKV